MQTKIDAAQVRREYLRGTRYKEALGLYETVKQNERFFEDNQWEGLKTKIVKPLTMNTLRRPISYLIAMLVSDDIGIEIRPFGAGEAREQVAKVLERAIDRVIERQKIKAKNRECIRDAAVDGDVCMYFWFDPEIETGQLVTGDIRAELIQNTNVIFGDPHHAEVQEQPYILIVRRRQAETVRREARERGVADADRITEDGAENKYHGEQEDGESELVTEITRFWKQKNEEGRATVRYMTVAGDVVTKGETDTGYTLYPLAYWNWEKRKNSYHGISPITGVINTQISINRIWTAIDAHVHNIAFPKLLYDRTKLGKWDGTPGQSVGVNGAPERAVMAVNGGVNLPTIITQVLQMMKDAMRDCMGASDAALGDVKTDNASAIIAVQQATAAPLELQRLGFYQFVEDYVRVIVDIMAARYGVRTVTIMQETTDLATGARHEQETEAALDFSTQPLSAMDIVVEVGAASYWAELKQIQTADNLQARGIFTSPVSYLESIPDGLIRDKNKLLREVREAFERQQGMAAVSGAAQGGTPGMAPPGQ